MITCLNKHEQCMSLLRNHLNLDFPLISKDISMGALEDACWPGTQTGSIHANTAPSGYPASTRLQEHAWIYIRKLRASEV